MPAHKSVKQYRYRGYDYSQTGLYFVTICVQGRERLFGEIVDYQMRLSDIGQSADRLWREIPNIFSVARLDEYVIMPDHIHGIIGIKKENNRIENDNENNCGNPENRRNAPRRVPTVFADDSAIVIKPAFNKPAKPQSTGGIHPLIKNSLSSIINHYKGGVKKFCNNNQLEYFAWQPRFHDRIIRDDDELERIRQYIVDNPKNWGTEK